MKTLNMLNKRFIGSLNIKGRILRKVSILRGALSNPDIRQVSMKWWSEARFGMFIHWGLYAVPAGVYKGRRFDGKNEQKLSSFIMKNAKIPISEYEQFAKRFDAAEFDAHTWVGLAKDAGMRYIVVTAKHHEGFCLWGTKTTDYNVVKSTPFKRDVLKEIAQECSAQNIKLCLYYSILDWHHPDFGRGGFDRYLTFMKGQLKELLTNYGPIGVLWFDGEWIQEWTETQGKQLYRYVKTLQPEIIVNNRVGKGRMGMQGMNKGNEYCGDFGTPEQEVPKRRPSGVLPWESCMTMNDTWGYKSYDFNWKSSKTLIRYLIDAVSKGGNFLLNVGPDASGLIPKASVERLQEIGVWMKVNGEAIYCASESPIGQPRWGRFTKRPGKLYAHIFDWPKDHRLRVCVPSHKLTRAYMLDDRDQHRLEMDRSNGEFVITLPNERRDQIATVVVLEIEGKGH